MSTERFAVPYPTLKAMEAHRDTLGSEVHRLYCAYAVDVPAIVRQEVERALRLFPITTAEREEVLRERFGETGEGKCPACAVNGEVNCPKHTLAPHPSDFPTPSAPAGHPCETVSKGGICFVNAITPADRALLQRVEKLVPFVEALMRRELCSKGHASYPMYDAAVQDAAGACLIAARKVVE